MAVARNSSLESLWLSGREGRLSPFEQVKAVAYRDVMRDVGVPEFGMLAEIAAKLEKMGGGAPTSEALAELFTKVDRDPRWFPGKRTGAKRGPKRTLRGSSARILAEGAMRLKRRKVQPTYAKMVSHHRKASMNPTTGKPFSKKVIYGIMRKKCFDAVPDKPCVNKARRTKKALPDKVKERRFLWGTDLRDNSLSVVNGWAYRNVSWIDLPNSILPRTELKAEEQSLARKGRKGWISPGSELTSDNLAGDRTALKQNSWDAERVWWMPVLARGKLHIEPLPGFPGENPEGARIAVGKLMGILNRRFPGENKPRVVMTDKGRGFFHPNGTMTPEYRSALQDQNLRAMQGEDARLQPGKLGDVLLHETAISWIRHKLELSLPREPWRETSASYYSRLKRICREINAEYDVDGLCRKWPERIAQLIRNEGDRLTN